MPIAYCLLTGLKTTAAYNTTAAGPDWKDDDFHASSVSTSSWKMRYVRYIATHTGGAIAIAIG